MKKLLILGVMFLAACEDRDTASRALDNMGLKPVKVGGYAMFSCSEDDTFHTKFTAINTAGKTVSGVVCSGWLKGATVRFD